MVVSQLLAKYSFEVPEVQPPRAEHCKPQQIVNEILSCLQPPGKHKGILDVETFCSFLPYLFSLFPIEMASNLRANNNLRAMASTLYASKFLSTYQYPTTS